MRRSAFSDDEIIRFVRDLEGGTPADEICRLSGVSRRTLYRWRREFGGLKPYAVQKLRSLEQENHRLRAEAQRHQTPAKDPPAKAMPGVRSDVGNGTAPAGAVRPSVVGRFAGLRLR